MMQNVQGPILVHRADILSFLIAQLLAGADMPTLLQVAVWAQVDREFISEASRLNEYRTIYLERN